ncbi:MAG: Gfo/Idh/MocA family oxidoreductase [Methylobacteriaceae bacterium]|nr:Gfo/Idh/MocA family oxidoreductase [Methylobacteriaceae bacterium]
MKKLRIGVVGVGFIGQLHARTVAESETAELAAVVDLAAAHGKAIAERYSTNYFADVEQACSAGVEAFIVALPDTVHMETTCRLLELGRSVLVEKPMAHSLAAAKAMAAAERQGGGRLLVAHILRFDPRYVQAADAVRQGRIGQPVHASSGRFTVRDVGVRLNGTSSPCFYLGVHDVDALQWITGASIARVYSRAVAKLMPRLGVKSDDAIFTTCELADGTTGQLYCGWTLPSDIPTGIWARTEVIGTEGVIDLDVRDHGLRIHSSGAWALPDGLHWPEVNGRIMGDLREEVTHFAEAVRTEKPFVMSVAEALRAVAANDAILRSVASGQPEAVESWRI